MTHRVGALALFTLVALASTSPALAQSEGASLDAFEVGKIQDQMELDVTPVPVGMGAVFVPSLTEPTLEPRIIVFSGTDRVASGQPGKRIVLPPGSYRVVYGAGPEEARASREVRVVEGVTTPLEPFFGGVRITAVNTAGRPVETKYVLAALGNNTVWPVRETSEAGSYNKTETWILPPGRYTLALGADPSADEGRIAFSLAQGEVLRYRMVVDGDKLVRVDFAEREVVVEPKIWRFQWVLGGDFGFERTSRQLASFNGDALRIGAYTNATAGLDTGNHLALLSLKLDESWLALESEFGRGLPLQKLTDELNMQLIYNYRLGGIIGPYMRASGRTSFFKTYYFPEEDVTIETRDIDGDVVVRSASRGDDVRLSTPLYPLITQEGVGLGLTFIDNDIFTFIVRGGGAARQSRYNGARLITGSQNGRVQMLRLADKQDFGGEATALVGLRLGGIFSVESSFERKMRTSRRSTALTTPSR